MFKSNTHARDFGLTSLAEKKQTHDPIAKNYGKLEAMVKWEQGMLSDEATIKLFQLLIDTGEAWQLQGCYGRAASCFIHSGDCKARYR